MTPERRQYIIEELTTLLQRVPTENEIQNAVTDTYIMGRVKDREIQDLLNR